MTMAPLERLHNIHYGIVGSLPLAASSLECPIKNRHLRGAAARAVGQARKRGILVPPVACSQCGTEGRLHGHHDDYAEPLAVRWLCRSCHVQYHTFLRRVFPELKPQRQSRLPVTSIRVVSPYRTADEACAYLGCTSLLAFQELRCQYDIVAYRIGRTRLFKQADLDAALEQERPARPALRKVAG